MTDAGELGRRLARRAAGGPLRGAGLPLPVARAQRALDHGGSRDLAEHLLRRVPAETRATVEPAPAVRTAPPDWPPAPARPAPPAASERPTPASTIERAAPAAASPVERTAPTPAPTIERTAPTIERAAPVPAPTIQRATPTPTFERATRAAAPTVESAPAPESTIGRPAPAPESSTVGRPAPVPTRPAPSARVAARPEVVAAGRAQTTSPVAPAPRPEAVEARPARQAPPIVPAAPVARRVREPRDAARVLPPSVWPVQAVPASTAAGSVIRRVPAPAGEPAAAAEPAPAPPLPGGDELAPDRIAEVADRVYALIVERVGREGERRGMWS